MSESKAQFKIIENGPLELTGHFRIADAGNRIIANESPVYLCRCGGSSNKPFCDDTHKRNGFTG